MLAQSTCNTELALVLMFGVCLMRTGAFEHVSVGRGFATSHSFCDTHRYCTALYGGDGQMTVTSPNSRGRRDGVEGDRDSCQFERPPAIFFWIFCDFFQCHADLLTTEATVTVTHRDGGDATAPP
jgi:hypothetical protein